MDNSPKDSNDSNDPNDPFITPEYQVVFDRRQADGSWKMHRTMMTSDSPSR